MRWLRRVLVGVLALILLATLLGIYWVVTVHRDANRDEQAFIDDVRRGTMHQPCAGCKRVSTLASVSDDTLLAEGDRACAWLREQPYPWWRRSRDFTYSGLMDGFRAAYPAAEMAWVAESTYPTHLQSNLVGAAWSDLCGEAWELRQPHNPFNRPSGD